ncbi:MAG: Fe-S oxidoreductase [Deltaproteobacteria bacterium]|nr:MAG: Fe-S oxidoreductase [Deltaproteobacteria bacterium]
MTAPAHVALFIPCLVDTFAPDVGKAMVQIFEKQGVTLSYPLDQTCCGQPAYNAGYRNEARTAATRFIDIFESADAIVCPSGSCVHMVRHHYLELFADVPRQQKRARAIADKTFEFTEYIVDVLKVTDLGTRYNGQVTYHDSCHLRYGLNISRQPRQLIENVDGCRLVEMEEADRCCGFGGSFSIKYPEISTAMLEDKVNRIVTSGADTVVGCDMGCLLNISGMINRRRLPVKVLHMAQLLSGQGKSI